MARTAINRKHQSTMFTQALPYSSGPPTYQPLNPSKRPSMPLGRSASTSSHKISFSSFRSNKSGASSKSSESTESSESKKLKSLLPSVKRSTSLRKCLVPETESDDEAHISILSEKKKQKRSSVVRDQQTEKMFSWAALGAYSAPGAGPLVWF
ncbi:hypothetical protein WHR41_07163 [Cladosporium halotolerans]|uniref:Uncharacterized protein n=1 Tax=Cladosporium halotolerans TaxID=1052096 RepID=A0AB34KJD1_9PEZI